MSCMSCNERFTTPGYSRHHREWNRVNSTVLHWNGKTVFLLLLYHVVLFVRAFQTKPLV
jgi:hypothetical protein